MKKQLAKYSHTANKTNKKIAVWLISNKEKLVKIVDLAERIEVSVSSIHRFITDYGSLSFKHFLFDYNNISEKENNKSPSKGNLKDVAIVISNFIKNKHINISSSRRGKSIAKYLNERLNDGDFSNTLFKEYSGPSQIEKIKKPLDDNEVFLIFDLSGSSYRVFDFYSNAHPSNMDKCLVISAGHTSSKLNNFTHISLSQVLNKKIQFDTWTDYNDALNIIYKLVHSFLKNMIQN